MITKIVHPAATIVQIIASYDELVMALNDAAAIIHRAGPLNIYQMNVAMLGGAVQITISAPSALVNFADEDRESL